MRFFLCLSFFFPLAAFSAPECEDHYFGLEHPRDLQKAFACYTKEAAIENNDYGKEMLALMHANGEGTPKDLAKAKSLLQEIKADDPLKAQLLVEIDKQLATPSKKLIDFCGDLAQTQIDLNVCASMKNLQAKRQRVEAEKKIQSESTPATKKALAKLTKRFDAFTEKEGLYVMSTYEGGSIAPMIAASTVQNLQNSHRELLESGTDHFAGLVLATQDAELNKKYGELVKRLSENSKKKLREAQREWVAYRDAFGEYAATKNPKTRQLMKARVTELRTKDFAEALKDAENH